MVEMKLSFSHTPVFPSAETFQAFHICCLFSYRLAISLSLFHDNVSRVGLGLRLSSDSVSMCLKSFMFFVRVSGVAPRSIFSLTAFTHFVFHPAVTINVSVPMFSLFQSQSVSLPYSFLSVCRPHFSDFLVERDNDYCVCETPCNLTRYGKELSFVKIPSKASAKYLAKKFNKTEQYIA